jgi:GTP cyclohydrolase III
VITPKSYHLKVSGSRSATAEQIPHALRSHQRLDLRGFGMADRPDDVFIHAEVSMEELRRKKTSSQRLVFA